MERNDIIKLLPDSVANQIAAGEVIQRPASVVKELVENSVDAGATEISIIIKDAGRTLIQVVDNGKGMSPADARMAFERHATSKIASADDLYSLHTMGFRGEALASIAAVAQIELRTMRPDDTVGCRITISASHVEDVEACSCVPGTNLMVKNLFAYLPARRKFLKKDPVELSHILHEFERLALVNTDVDFTIISNDAVLHQLRHASLKQRIGDLFGKALERQIVPVSTETSIVRISGYVGLPQFARRRDARQFLFVNGRNMQHPYFRRAILSCYEKLVTPDLQPSYFVNFDVDPARIDVNIHPQKHEIKFEDEQAVWQILVAAVKEALGRTNAAGAIDFNVDDAPEIPAFSPDPTASPETGIDNSYNPFDDRTPTAPSPRYGVDRQTYSGGFERRRSSSLEEVRSALNLMDHALGEKSVRQLGLDELPDSDPVTQNSSVADSSYIEIGKRYIATPVREGMMVIDRHRAHIRVLYDRIMACIAEGPIATQRMIFPETVVLSAAEDLLLASVSDSLALLGFDISPLGDNTWVVNGMPPALNSAPPDETIRDIITRLGNSGEMPDKELFATIAISMARISALNASNRLSQEETDILVADLFKTSSPNYTPDGLKIVLIIPTEDIAKLFN